MYSFIENDIVFLSQIKLKSWIGVYLNYKNEIFKIQKKVQATKLVDLLTISLKLESVVAGLFLEPNNQNFQNQYKF